MSPANILPFSSALLPKRLLPTDLKEQKCVTIYVLG